MSEHWPIGTPFWKHKEDTTMAGTPQFADISVFQSANINWTLYKQWAAQWDGISRVSLRSSYGTGFTDANYHAYRAGALAAGVDVIIHYHYAYPSLNAATAEADWQHSVVGDVRANDVLMLDFEESSPLADAAWAYAWLARQEANYGGKLPTIYAADAYIRARLQDARLARYPLTLANWQFTPTERPACPPPWTRYEYLQWTDRADIPGIGTGIDCNLYMGGPMANTIPTGWTDDGTTLTAPNGVKIVQGFRQWVLAHTWDTGNTPMEAEYAANPVLLHNPAVGAGSRQCFRDCLLWYTAAKGVVQEPYTAWELDAAYKALAAQPAPVPVDTSTVAADINAIADAIVAPVAKALADLKKL